MRTHLSLSMARVFEGMFHGRAEGSAWPYLAQTWAPGPSRHLLPNRDQKETSDP